MPTPPENPREPPDPRSASGDDPVLRSFERQISELVVNMKTLVKINQGLLDTMKLIAPPVGTRPGTTSEPIGKEPAPTPIPGPRPRPRLRADSDASMYDYDEQEQTESTFGQADPNEKQRPSNDDTNASRPSRSYFAKWASNGAPKLAQSQGVQDAVKSRALNGFRLPRYGEFNTQDVLNLSGNAMATGAEELAKMGVEKPNSILGSFANNKVGSAAMTALGVGTRATNAMATMVPYAQAFRQLTGIPTSPSGLNAEGTAMGYNQGGTNVGPLRIPGIGIGLHGIGISPAMTQGIQNSWQSFKYGLTPGGSSKLMSQMQGALQGEGWSGGTMRDMAGQYGKLAASEQYGNIGTPQELAPVMDQLVRYGSGGLDNLTASLKKIPDAALAANQSISQTVTGLNTFAQTQQSMGSTYSQGFNTAANMTTATGMTPTTNQQLLSNPLGQAFASEMTGGKIPAMVIGAASGSTQMAGQLKAMKMLQQAYKTAGYSPQVVDAMVGQQWGLSPEATAQYLNNGGNMNKKQSILDQSTKMNQKDNAFMQLSSTLPKGTTAEEAQSLAAKMGYKMTAAQKKQMADYVTDRSHQTHGGIIGIGAEDYSRQQDLQYGFGKELSAMETQKETPKLYKEARSLGMSKDEWKKISEDRSGQGPLGMGGIFGDNVTRASAGEISSRLSGWAKNNSQEIQNRQNLMGILELTPDAKRLVNLNLSNFKNIVNSGGASANGPAATSSMPNSTYASTPGGFSPAGSGVGVTGP